MLRSSDRFLPMRSGIFDRCAAIIDKALHVEIESRLTFRERLAHFLPERKARAQEGAPFEGFLAWRQARFGSEFDRHLLAGLRAEAIGSHGPVLPKERVRDPVKAVEKGKAPLAALQVPSGDELHEAAAAMELFERVRISPQIVDEEYRIVGHDEVLRRLLIAQEFRAVHAHELHRHAARIRITRAIDFRIAVREADPGVILSAGNEHALAQRRRELGIDTETRMHAADILGMRIA